MSTRAAWKDWPTGPGERCWYCGDLLDSFVASHTRFHSSTCRARFSEAKKAGRLRHTPRARLEAQLARKRSQTPSDKRLAYSKAVEALTEWLVRDGRGRSEAQARYHARVILNKALPPRLKGKL